MVLPQTRTAGSQKSAATSCNLSAGSYAAVDNLPTIRTPGAADNTPSHACGYRLGCVVHRALQESIMRSCTGARP
jgi:hypothetical protein